LLAHAPLLSTGTSTSTRTQDAAGNFAFAYNEQHSTGGSSRKEAGNPHGVSGSYTMNVADGRQRVVKYVADGHGFRAAIATNEPGTAASYPAAASISSPYAMPVAPEPIAVAPIAHAPVAVAPAPLALPALGYKGYAAAPALGYAPVAIAPAVSSYSTSISHAAPVAVKAIAAPLVIPAAPAFGIKGAYGGYGKLY
jgi:hypothetical protein